jgi:hypothetical protein
MSARFWTSGSSDRDGTALQSKLVSCLFVVVLVGALAMTGNFIGDVLGPVTEELGNVVFAVSW